MKKPQDEQTDELRPEYDMKELLRTGVRGKYAERYREGTEVHTMRNKTGPTGREN